MFSTKYKIKKGDKVIVTAGKDKGKTGEVLKMLTEEARVIVQGVNVQTRHKKPSQLGPGGLEKIEAPIHISNVALVDPKTGKATRVGYKVLANGEKSRVAKRSGEVID